MAIYNTTNFTSSNNFMEFTQALNTASENWFGIMLYISLLIILFVTLKRGTAAKTTVIMAVCGWFGLVFVMLLRAMKLVPPYFVILAVITSIGMAALIFVQQPEN